MERRQPPEPLLQEPLLPEPLLPPLFQGEVLVLLSSGFAHRKLTQQRQE